ncbi:DUF6056 family protein [Castellaniella sp.]|uniref:DUF6056 family protein n=1 Tax=Castellaniella sp. TaxID=1955812 RepID=UPI003568423C
MKPPPSTPRRPASTRLTDPGLTSPGRSGTRLTSPGRIGPSRIVLAGASLVILASAGLLNGLAPMSSDDYSYVMKGVSWAAMRDHYMGWSGRLVADTLSSLVLGWGTHWADAVNTGALVWILATLGQRLAGKASWVPDARVLFFIFILYWVNNPKLGHTTFWIVGAANYLWTHAILFGFVLAFVAALQGTQQGGQQATQLGGRLGQRLGRLQGGQPHRPLWQGLALAVLGLAAGCTNENTAPTAWLLLAWLTWQARPGRQRARPADQARIEPASRPDIEPAARLDTNTESGPRPDIPQGAARTALAWPVFWLACMALGMAVLLLSPGDLHRAAHPSNREWYDTALGWRIEYHLVRRFPDSMAKYWQAALVLLWGAACIRLPRPVARRIGLLVGLACIANLALVFAPPYPKRALQGGFMFMLLAVAVMGHQAVQPGALRRARLLALGLALCALQWLVSFGLLLRAYHGTALQDELRVALIQKGLAEQAPRIEIPKYYFSPLLNSRDQFDIFFNGEAMAAYYGTQAQIVEYPVTGPYDIEHPPAPTPSAAR